MSARAMRRRAGTGVVFGAMGIALGVACSGKILPPPGQIVVRVDSDLAIPGEWDHLQMDVSVRGKPISSSVTPVGGTDLAIPGTLDLVQGSNPSTPVTIRASAHKGTVVIVAQQFVTEIPSGRVALLEMTLERSCVDVTCLPDQTCQYGKCVAQAVDPNGLPTYGSDAEPPGPPYDAGTNPDDGVTAPEAGGDATTSDAGRDAVAGDAALGDANSSDSGCTNTATDSNNCGACGHSCLGGACIAGVCQPVALATGAQSPYGIAVDATNVYWSSQTNGLIMKMPIAGGPATTLATGQAKPTGIAIDANYVYWANYTASDNINKVPIAGGTVTPVATAQSNPTWVVVDATNAYWTTTNNNGTVYKVPLTGLGTVTPTPLSTGQAFPWGIAVDAKNVYFSNLANNTIVGAVPIAGGATTPLGTGQKAPYGVAVYAGNVYWVENVGGGVWRAPAGGGGATQLASGQSKAFGIAVDASGIYWTLESAQGTVSWLALSGGTVTPKVLASGQANARGIVTDATSVYWVNGTTGEVMRLAK